MGRGSNLDNKALGLIPNRLGKLFKSKPVLVLNKEEKLLIDLAEKDVVYACPECEEILVLDSKRLLASIPLSDEDLVAFNRRLWRLDIDTRSWEINEPDHEYFICYCCGLDQGLDKF